MALCMGIMLVSGLILTFIYDEADVAFPLFIVLVLNVALITLYLAQVRRSARRDRTS